MIEKLDINKLNYLRSLGLKIEKESSLVSDSLGNVSNSENFVRSDNKNLYCCPFTGKVEEIDLYYTLTIDDILRLLPSTILDGYKYNVNNVLYIKKFLIGGKFIWSVGYGDFINFNNCELINSLYYLLCWCIENKFVTF